MVIEGLDGAGKRTLAERLVHALDAKVARFAFPRYTEDVHAQLVREALYGRMGDLAASVHGMAVLADARSTDPLVRELQAAADEGMSVVASSPFRVRHRQQVRAISELVEPLDRALRSTRVLVRQVAVAAYRGQPIPDEYADLAGELAEAADLIVEELRANRMAVAVQGRLVEIGEASARVPRSGVLNAEGVLLQLRSVIVDLLQLTGMGQFEATDALPPLL